MRVRVEWDRNAFRTVNYEEAALVGHAVLRFAATGEGDVAARQEDPTAMCWLHVPPFAAQLIVYKYEQRVRLIAVYRVDGRRLPDLGPEAVDDLDDDA